MHRLVSPFILAKYAAGESSGRLDAATLFVDMSGFSAMTSALMEHGQHGAEVLATVMRAIYQPLVEAVYAHGGFITVFAGDAFTAVFPTDVGRVANSPYALPGDAGRVANSPYALAAAWAMREHMQAHPRHATPYGEFEVAAKIGLAAGEVDWGIIRAEDNSRAAFYFRGPAIDGAAQAEQQARRGDFILHPSAQAALADRVSGEPADDYRRVTGLIGVQPLPQPQPVALPPVQPEIEARFYPRDIIGQSETGEFRQAINVFVGLECDPTAEQLNEFMQHVFNLQAKYGGLFNRLDFGDKGCSLLLFWGAPVSHENDVLRALNFLLELHDVTPFPIRAGVTSRISHAGFIGSALHEEYTCYGAGVNLAARFMTSAPAESIWVDEPVNLRAVHQFEMEYEGDFPFKGFEEPQAVFALLGREAAEVIDFYNRKMVGRQEELARLAAFVQPLFAGQQTSAAAGQPEVGTVSKVASQPRRFAGVLVVSGEAGIGKSRLLHEFTLSRQISETCRVFVCQTDQIMRQPLNPFRYWLRDYFGQSADQSEAHNKRVFSHRLAQIINATSDEAVQAELERNRSVLGALLDLHWPDSWYARLDPQSRYESTLNALKTLILAESLRQPVILQLEDIHWLDQDSCQFLPRLTRGIEAYPIAILATRRPEGAEPFCGVPVSYERLELAGLAPEEVTGLAADLLAGTPGPRLLALLGERAGGNPFFAEQILLYLRDEGLLDRDDGVWEPREKALKAAPLPANVRAIFIARLDRLTHEVREVVQTAAVLGREFEVQVLARILRHEALRQEVELAEQAAIWTALAEMRYLFKHVLLRDAAYDMQVRTRRGELHRLAAEALETLYAERGDPSLDSGQGLPAHYGELAYHFEAACLSGFDALRSQARRYLSLAGEQAKSKAENTAAIDYFSRGLALTPDDDLGARFELLHARESVYDTRGEREPQAQDLAAMEALAEALRDDHRLAEAALRRSNYAERTSDFGTAIAAAERAVAFAQAAGDVARETTGYWLWGTALWRKSDYPGAKAQLGQALALAQEAKLADQAPDVHLVLAFVAQDQGAWAEVEREIGLALPIFRAQGDLAGEMAAVNTLGINCHEQGDYAGARAYFEQALGLARQAGRRLSEARYLNNLANAWQGLGDWAKAQAHLEQALRVSQEIGHRDGEAVIYNNLATLSTKQGDLARAVSGFEQALAILREVVHRSQESETLAYLGGCNVLGGDYEAARGNCQQALEIARELGSRSLEGMPLTNLGHALAGLDQLDEARQAYGAAVEVREALNQLDAAMEARAGLARVALAQGDLPAATAQVQIIVDHIGQAPVTSEGTGASGVGHGLAGAEDPVWVYLTWHQVWATTGDPRAMVPLEKAHHFLEEQAAKIEDEAARQRFLENTPSHREIIALYRRLHAEAARSEPPAVQEAGTSGPTPPPPSPIDVTSGNLAGRNLIGATLSGLSLRGADLNHADLRGADLSKADLRGADLSHANLRGADLTGADLRGADLTGADLRGADFTGVQLRGADLTDAIHDAHTVWPEELAPPA